MRLMKAAGHGAACLLASALLVLAGQAAAMEKGHEGMSGMKDHGGMSGMKEHGAAEGHGMMKMGDKVFGGKIGPWTAEARLTDMKAKMAQMKLSEKQMAMMKNTHHLSVSLSDPSSKKAVTEGKGSVTVTGPDKKSQKFEFAAMEGHFGADVNLPKPGKYTFQVEIESAGKTGTARFTHTVK